MITAFFRGRLGNHLRFIYTTFKYCKNKNIDFDKIAFVKYSDTKFYEYSYYNRNSDYYRHIYYMNECFPMYSEYLQSKFTLSHADLAKQKLILNASTNHNHKDNFYFYLYSSLKISFSNCDEELVEQLFYNKKYYDKVFEERNYLGNNLGIHVRRGDFLTHRSFKKSVFTKDSFNDTIKNNLNKFDKIVIFSDDIKWCKGNLENEYKDKVIFDETKSACDTIIRMSSCREVIKQSYSSFSEWGKNLSPIINRIYGVRK